MGHGIFYFVWNFARKIWNFNGLNKKYIHKIRRKEILLNSSFRIVFLAHYNIVEYILSIQCHEIVELYIIHYDSNSITFFLII